MIELLSVCQSELDALYSPAGYNIGINDGAAAGQTVPHVHMHLIPRYAGDVEDPRGGVRWVVPNKARYWP
jgi:diadenosine tetraphosphate (Ap4A) HIT family hydrolase